MSYIDLDGYHIKKKDINEIEYKQIIKELSVKPNNNVYIDENIVYNQYKIKDDELIVPKFYGIKKFGLVNKRNYNPEKIKIPFLGNLRNYQIPIVDKCLAYIQETGGCQMSVPCGYGKTIMSIYIAHKLGLKTLVLVHKSFLQDQWIKCIQQFTGTYSGIIRCDQAQTKGYAFSVGMIQSIGRRDYGKIFEKFGLIICDECHRYASKWFSRTISRITGLANTLGLSATLYRGDGLIRIVNWYLGDVAYQEKNKENNQVCVKVLTFSSSSEKKFVEKTRFFRRKSLPDVTKMINNLVDIPDRNNMVISVINEIRKNPERKILVLSGRKETHLYMLKEKVDELIDMDVKNGKLLKEECQTFFYIGDTKQKDRFRAEKDADILFATYEMAQEGLDIERLNTIVLATPKKDVVQAIGRILRKILENGDTRPLVIDIVDDLSIFRSQARVREKNYIKNKYFLQYYYVYNDKLVSSKKYLELTGMSGNANDNVPKSWEEAMWLPIVDLNINNEVIPKKQDLSSEKVLKYFDCS